MEKQLIQVGHPYANHVEDKAKKILINNIEIDEEIEFRHYNLEDTTEDPGNTGLYISYIQPMLEDREDLDDLHDALLEDEGSGGMGDYEEVYLMNQNNETIVIISSFK